MVLWTTHNFLLGGSLIWAHFETTTIEVILGSITFKKKAEIFVRWRQLLYFQKHVCSWEKRNLVQLQAE